MFGITAYFMVMFLYYDYLGGFDTEQWAWFIVTTIVGIIWELTEVEAASRRRR